MELLAPITRTKTWLRKINVPHYDSLNFHLNSVKNESLCLQHKVIRIQTCFFSVLLKNGILKVLAPFKQSQTFPLKFFFLSFILFYFSSLESQIAPLLSLNKSDKLYKLCYQNLEFHQWCFETDCFSWALMKIDGMVNSAKSILLSLPGGYDLDEDEAFNQIMSLNFRPNQHK